MPQYERHSASGSQDDGCGSYSRRRSDVQITLRRAQRCLVMMLWPKLHTVQLLMFAATGVALPQPAPFERGVQPPVAVRTTPRLVEVNVIVRDQHGEPVPDLKKEDFRLYDNGKLQQISAFAVYSKALLPGAPALPPNTFNNWAEQKSQLPASVTVILLDTLNSHIEDRQWKKKVVNVLTGIRPEDRVAVYALGHGLHILHDFTGDSSLLLQQPARRNGSQLRAAPASEASSGADPAAVALNAWLSGTGVSREQTEFYAVSPVTATSRAMQLIANHLAGLPGRKNLIWVSGGFPYDAVLTLDHANVAIYPVDAWDLEPHFTAANPIFVDPGRPQQPGTTSSTEKSFELENQRQIMALDNERRRLAELQNQQNQMMESEYQQRKGTTEIAARTGGRAYGNSNDLAKAIRDAVKDSTLTYTLGFYPNGHANDGKFYNIEVKLPERGSLNLHYRKGYVAQSEGERDASARRNALRDAVWSPVESSSIGMTVQIAPASAARPNDLNVVLGIDTAGIGLTPEGDRRNGAVDVLFIQKDADGRFFDGVNTTMTLRLTPDLYEKYRNGLRFQQFVPRQTGATHLRVIVRDPSTGRMGSVTVPFDQLR
jgi:VWFA-related protein